MMKKRRILACFFAIVFTSSLNASDNSNSLEKITIKQNDKYLVTLEMAVIKAIEKIESTEQKQVKSQNEINLLKEENKILAKKIDSLSESIAKLEKTLKDAKTTTFQSASPTSEENRKKLEKFINQ